MVTVNFFATPPPSKTIFRCPRVLEFICRSKSSWSRTLNDYILFARRSREQSRAGQAGGENHGTIARSSINHNSLVSH